MTHQVRAPRPRQRLSSLTPPWGEKSNFVDRNCLWRSALLALALHSPISAAQLPTSGQFTAAPDEWLLSDGQPWHHKTGAAETSVQLIFREPVGPEKTIVARAQQLFDRSSAKSMALFDGNEVVWAAYKPPATSSKRLLSFSVGKTITAMAVGKAICTGLLSLDSRVGKVVPELAETDLGKATIEDLLKMSSGTWQGNPDSTIISTEQDQRIRQGTMTFLEVLTTSKVNAAEQNVDGRPRRPGDYFVYHSTDPLALGIALNKVTGTTYARYVEREVLLAAGIARPAIIGQDRFGYGAADGNVRMHLEDWIRFAVWVKVNQSGSGCFSDFVRKATTSRITNASKKSGAAFDGYGYLTWTDNIKARRSYWAVGHGGQRIGWNHDNMRMLVAFSNVENYMLELYALYADWAALGSSRQTGIGASGPE